MFKLGCIIWGKKNSDKVVILCIYSYTWFPVNFKNVKIVLSIDVRSWFSTVIIWKGHSLYLYMYVREFDQKVDTVHKHTIVFSYMYYLLFRCLWVMVSYLLLVSR